MNRNLVPNFILEKLNNNKLAGEFKGVAMFIDVVGFTSLTQELIRHGKEGAEILSDIINSVFTNCIDQVKNNNGFISNFTGDGFTAVFQYNHRFGSLNTANNLRKIFQNYNVPAKSRKFRLKIRISLAYGQIRWKIIPGPEYRLFSFLGQAIQDSANANELGKSGIISVHKSLLQLIKSPVKGQKLKTGGMLIKNFPQIPYKTVGTIFNKHKKLQKEFIKPDILNLSGLGEFRNTANVFISFRKNRKKNRKSYLQLNKIGKLLFKLSSKFSGYFNKLELSDKGLLGLVIFGAPAAQEKPVLTAIRFAFQLLNEFPKSMQLKIGITYGKVYAGFLGSDSRSEYTVLGSQVNLAARIALSSPWNSIQYSTQVHDRITQKYSDKHVSKRKLKGFKKKIELFQLIKPRRKLKPELLNIEFKNFISRKKELKKLIDTAEQVVIKNISGTVYIFGKAGIGKSRLVNEFKKQTDHRFNWVILRCERLIQTGFHPFIHYFKLYFGITDKMPKSKSIKVYREIFKQLVENEPRPGISNKLSRIESILAGLIGIEWKHSLYSQLEPIDRFKNFLEAIRLFFLSISRNNPLGIHVDDLHWADKKTKDALKYLIQGNKSCPILTVITSRDEKIKINLKPDPVIFKKINMLPFTKHDSVSMVHRITKGLLPEKIERVIVEKASGNPFFIQQLCLFILEEQELNPDLKFQQLDIPDKISDIIISRIDKLEGHLKEIIKKSSVIGREFSILILEKLLDNPGNIIHVKTIEKENIWHRINELNYIFSHALIRDAVYEMQLKKVLTGLHLLVAEVIEEVFSAKLEPQFEKLAYHFEKGGELEKARKYILKAGDYCVRRFENEKAIDYYKKYLNFEKQKPKQTDLLIKLGLIYNCTGDWCEAESAFKEALRLSKQLKDNRLITNASYHLSDLYSRWHKYEASLKFAKLAEKHSLKTENDFLMHNIFMIYSNIYRKKRMFDEALSFSKRHLELAKKIGDKQSIALAHGCLGIIYFFKNKVKLSINNMKKELKLQKQLNNLRGIGNCLGNLGIVYYNLTRYSKAKLNYDKQLEIAIKTGDRDSEARVLLNYGNLLADIAEFDDAFEKLFKALDIYYEINSDFGIALTLGNIGTLYQDIFDFKKALSYFLRQREFIKKKNNKNSLIMQGGSLSTTYAYLGDFNKSKTLLNRFFGFIENPYDKMSAYHYRGIFYYLQNKLGYALNNLDKGISWAKEIDNRMELSGLRFSKAKVLFLRNSFEKIIPIAKSMLEMKDTIKIGRPLIYNRFIQAISQFKSNPDICQSILKDIFNDPQIDYDRLLCKFFLYHLNPDCGKRKDLEEEFMEQFKKTGNIELRLLIDYL